jgi:DNA repair exonuclease SbcCD ATPase subunit
MKKVVLKSLAMRNFRGEKERTTVFNQSVTTIAGENGIGKSRHFDAFVWCLFGKDTKERKDYNIRTLVDGEPLHRVECSVEAELEVDGQPLKIKRAFVEKWVRQRGAKEETFQGNQTETFWNDVPVGVTDYQKRVGELINESVFKMLTNPLLFAGMKWQEQREQLFQLAGTISDAEIAAGNPDYLALLDKISGKSMTEFKREVAARKKKLKEEAADIQPRIDQTQKLMPEEEDNAQLSSTVEFLEKEIASIDASLQDRGKQHEGMLAAQRDTRLKIAAIRQEMDEYVRKAETAASEAAYQAGAERRKLEAKVAEATDAAIQAQKAVQRLTAELAELQGDIEAKNAKIEEGRREWYEESIKEYGGDDTCPTCGTLLHEAIREAARKKFDAAKMVRLDAITRSGKRLVAEMQGLTERLSACEKELAATADDGLQKEDERERLERTLAQWPAQAVTPLCNPRADEAYVALGKKIETLEKVLDIKPSEDAVAEELRGKKAKLIEDMNRLKERLHNASLIERYKGEIASLETRGKELVHLIAEAEGEEYVMTQFSKARVEECERRINGLFTAVTFRLFEYTIDGNESETCVPLVNGVPFGAANTAGQINAGLDIINALTRFHGVCAPIFVDNRESVNRLIDTEAQVINLVVTTDKEIKVS